MQKEKKVAGVENGNNGTKRKKIKKFLIAGNFPLYITQYLWKKCEEMCYFGGKRVPFKIIRDSNLPVFIKNPKSFLRIFLDFETYERWKEKLTRLPRLDKEKFLIITSEKNLDKVTGNLYCGYYCHIQHAIIIAKYPELSNVRQLKSDRLLLEKKISKLSKENKKIFIKLLKALENRNTQDFMELLKEIPNLKEFSDLFKIFLQRRKL